MKDIWKILIIIIVIALIGGLIAFFVIRGNDKSEKDDLNTTSSTLDYVKNKGNSNNKEEDEASKFMKEIKNITSEEALAKADNQMKEPNEGDQIAIFHIKGYGDIKVKFFENVAPKAVENFITHAKEGILVIFQVDFCAKQDKSFKNYIPCFFRICRNLMSIVKNVKYYFLTVNVVNRSNEPVDLLSRFLVRCLNAYVQAIKPFGKNSL